MILTLNFMIHVQLILAAGRFMLCVSLCQLTCRCLLACFKCTERLGVMFLQSILVAQVSRIVARKSYILLKPVLHQTQGRCWQKLNHLPIWGWLTPRHDL